MTSLFIDMLGNKIASILETQKINEDYENKLKPTIKKKTKDFIDAICKYLSNSEIKECRSFKKLGYITEDELNTLGDENPIKYIKNAANKYIENYLDVSPDEFSTFLLNYKPIPKNTTQSGGDIDYVRKAAEERHEEANRRTATNYMPEVFSHMPANMTADPTKMPEVLDSMPANMNAVPTNMPAVPNMTGLSNFDMSNMAQILDDKELLNKLIKTNKATELYDFYNEQTLAKLTCNPKIHEYINDKIINTIFYITLKQTEGDKVNKIKSLMLPISQKVTETVINNKIQSLEKNTGIYKILFDSLKNQPNYVENMETHTNAYLLTLLELFLHFKHNEVLNNPFSLNIKLEDINKRIDILRTDKLKGMINTALSKLLVNDIERINDLNKLQKNNEKDHNGNALKEFKKLFEKKPEEKKGGKRKQQTKRKSLRKNNRSKKKKH